MARRKVVFTLVLCSLIGMLGIQALSEARAPGAAEAQRPKGMTAAEAKREVEKRRKEARLERERKERERRKKSAERKRKSAEEMKELAKEGRGPSIDRKQRAEENRREAAEIRKEFLRERAALGVTEEQWELIKPKLEKVRQLQDEANSKVGVFLAGGSSSGTGPNGPAFQWKTPWKDKPPEDLTEAQRLTKQLIALVGRESTSPQAFRLKMAALREARKNEAEIQRRLAQAREELCGILTTRQEAALVLMHLLL